MPDKVSKEALDKGLISKKQYNNLNSTLLTAISTKKLKENKNAKPTKQKLTKPQENKLKEHSNHHSKKHINLMKKEMLDGKTFTQAHNKAKKQVGK